MIQHQQNIEIDLFLYKGIFYPLYLALSQIKEFFTGFFPRFFEKPKHFSFTQIQEFRVSQSISPRAAHSLPFELRRTYLLLTDFPGIFSRGPITTNTYASESWLQPAFMLGLWDFCFFFTLKNGLYIVHTHRSLLSLYSKYVSIAQQMFVVHQLCQILQGAPSP